MAALSCCRCVSTWSFAGILRVQFFARRVALPGQFSDGETARGSRVLLNWGVGTTRIEAESERLRRRQQRQTRK